MEVLLWWIYGASAVAQTGITVWLYWGNRGLKEFGKIHPVGRAYLLLLPFIPVMNTVIVSGLLFLLACLASGFRSR